MPVLKMPVRYKATVFLYKMNLFGFGGCPGTVPVDLLTEQAQL
jgi:hypothetical protein